MVTGSSSGQVTCQKRCQRLAPSMAAASCRSGLMVCKPASRLIAENGTPRQIFTAAIDAIARSGSPSQLMRELMMCIFQKSQLKTLKGGGRQNNTTTTDA